MRPTVPLDGDGAGWRRRVATMLNLALSGYANPTVEGLPPIATVKDGCTVFDTVTGKVHTASGGAWQAHW
jgi:hypothetical protein